jgi:hypothetical protein
MPAEIGRNDRNSLKWAEIFSEVEQGGFLFRFAHRYEIFRPFRPERNGKYNSGCMCRSAGETVDHLFLYCRVVRELWSFVFRSFGIDWVLPN